MNAENVNTQESQRQQEETPLCLRCLRPADPLTYYCPHCGEATGQLTPYIPFVNIAWQTRIWGRMWRQVWSRKVSVPGRLFRLFLIVYYAPVLLTGLIFRPSQKTERTEHPSDADERGKKVET
jgi:predicted amidophosphoribosyltransferase